MRRKFPGRKKEDYASLEQYKEMTTKNGRKPPPKDQWAYRRVRVKLSSLTPGSRFSDDDEDVPDYPSLANDSDYQSPANDDSDGTRSAASNSDEDRQSDSGPEQENGADETAAEGSENDEDDDAGEEAGVMVSEREKQAATEESNSDDGDGSATD